MFFLKKGYKNPNSFIFEFFFFQKFSKNNHKNNKEMNSKYDIYKNIDGKIINTEENKKELENYLINSITSIDNIERKKKYLENSNFDFLHFNLIHSQQKPKERLTIDEIIALLETQLIKNMNK